MAVKIRLQRKGRRKKPFYHIVIADARSPRDGRFIEKIGTYNPMTVPATIDLDRDKAYEWLMNGAQPTDTARAILRFKGVLYRKHLMRGVKKGALTQEAADAQYEEWIAAKEAKVATRAAATKAEIDAFHVRVSGVAPPKPVKEVEETAEATPEATDNRPIAEQVEQTTVESVSAPAAEEEAPETPEVNEEAIPNTEDAPKLVAETRGAPEMAIPPTVPQDVDETPEPVKEEEAPAKEEAKPDDLKKIEGVGPKIAELLNNAGIITFAGLASTSVDRVKEILAAAGSRYTMHDPTTWGQQAQLAADGKWDELNKLQDELDGGKVVAAAPTADASKEEE